MQLGLGASYDKNNLKPAPYNLQQHIDIPSTKELVCEGIFLFFYIHILQEILPAHLLEQIGMTFRRTLSSTEYTHCVCTVAFRVVSINKTY